MAAAILKPAFIAKQRMVPANSVDFILTDPPYLVNYRDRDGRSIQNDADDTWLKPAMEEAYRVLKQDRMAVMFYGWTKVTLNAVLFHVGADLLAARAGCVEILLRIAFDLRRTTLAGFDFVAKTTKPVHQFRLVNRCGVLL